MCKCDPTKRTPWCGQADCRPQTELKQHKDGDGHYWSVRHEKDSEAVDVWWNREPKKRVGARVVQAEKLVIRQVGDGDSADVLTLTPGQVYDLIDALNRAVENT